MSLRGHHGLWGLLGAFAAATGANAYVIWHLIEQLFPYRADFGTWFIPTVANAFVCSASFAAAGHGRRWLASLLVVVPFALVWQRHADPRGEWKGAAAFD